MSDKPEKIHAYPGSLIYSLKPAELTIEYIRADLAKPSEWISVDDRLPEGGVPVIVFVKNAHGNQSATRRLRAMYVKQYFLPSDQDDFGEENPNDGEYYCPEGWYENNEFEDIHFAIDGDITHYQPLPEAPK